MKFLKKLQLLMLVSLLLSLQNLEAAKRALDMKWHRIVPQLQWLVREGDEDTGHRSWREGLSSKARPFVAKHYGFAEGVTGGAGAPSSSFVAFSPAKKALSQVLAASSVRSVGGAGAESAVAMGGAGGEAALNSSLKFKALASSAAILSEIERHQHTIENVDFVGCVYATQEVVRETIQRCPNLKKLSLTHCPGAERFIEGLPAGVGEQLEELNLEMSNVTAAQVSTILQHFPNLKKLNLGFCCDAVGFYEVLPAGVGKQLEELNLSMTGATADQIRAIVQRCSNLKKLNLSFCPGLAGFVDKLSDDVVLSLEELSLVSVYQGSGQLPPGQVPVFVTAGQIREIVQRCPQLKKLDLNNCSGAAGFIKGLPEGVVLQLEELNLEGTRATADQVWLILQRCLRLKKLSLYGCCGATEFIEDLPEGIEELNLSLTDATAGQIRAIVQRYPQLKKLNLSYCRGAAKFIEDLPAGVVLQLEELNLTHTDATAEQVRLILQRCLKLKKLDLSRCKGAAILFYDLPEGVVLPLEELNLASTNAADYQVRAIVERCPQIKKLNLFGCLRAAGFIEELEGEAGKQLEELNLGDTYTDLWFPAANLWSPDENLRSPSGQVRVLVTAEQVRLILQRCLKLKKLDLSHNKGSAEFIVGLPEGCGHSLEKLDLYRAGATVDQLAAIRARFPRCNVLC